MFSSWSRTQKNTPRPAAGDSATSPTANPATRRCTKLASPATSPQKLATMSSPATHIERQLCRAREGAERHVGVGQKAGCPAAGAGPDHLPLGRQALDGAQP